MKSSSRSRNTSVRKPSHLGSKIHPSPGGSSATRFASMGRIGGLQGRRMPHPTKPSRIPHYSSALRRQRKLECGAMENVRCGPETTAMALDDRATDRESHPHAALLRREERAEEPISLAWLEPDAGVLHGHHD